MVQLLAVQLSEPGTDENHIKMVRWYNPQDGSINVATVAVMVDWIQNRRGVAYTYDGNIRSDVVVSNLVPPGIRAKPPNGVRQTLLDLPRFV